MNFKSKERKKPVSVCPVRASSGRFAGNTCRKSFNEPTLWGFLRQHRMNKKNLIDTRSARVLVGGDSIPANIFRVFPKSYCSFAVSGDTVQDVGWKFGDVRIPANIKCVVLHVVFNDVLQGHGFCQIVCQYEVRFGPKKVFSRTIQGPYFLHNRFKPRRRKRIRGISRHHPPVVIYFGNGR